MHLVILTSWLHSHITLNEDWHSLMKAKKTYLKIESVTQLLPWTEASILLKIKPPPNDYNESWMRNIMNDVMKTIIFW